MTIVMWTQDVQTKLHRIYVTSFAWMNGESLFIKETPNCWDEDNDEDDLL